MRCARAWPRASSVAFSPPTTRSHCGSGVRPWLPMSGGWAGASSSRQAFDPVDDALRRRLIGVAMIAAVDHQELAVRVLGGGLVDGVLHVAVAGVLGADDHH